MAMTLRLSADEADALRARAELQGRSMHDVARQAVREYVGGSGHAYVLDQVLSDEHLPYTEALHRLRP